jgi:hypothetical protein
MQLHPPQHRLNPLLYIIGWLLHSPFHEVWCTVWHKYNKSLLLKLSVGKNSISSMNNRKSPHHQIQKGTKDTKREDLADILK